LSVTLADKYKPHILAVWALLVFAYVWFKAPIIWQADWSHDDLMNAYRAMTTSWSDLLQQTVFFWQPTPVFRPLGEIFYKVLWGLFGFDPLPWRLACGALLTLNAFILGHVATRISGSLSVGLAATAIASFHSQWGHLYLNTGTIFEILAFTFVYAGLAWYVEFEDPWLTTILLILGLNSKESAVVLPALVVLYEWIWKRRTPWLYIALSVAVCGAFIAGRVYGPQGLSSIGAYQPNYSVGAYFVSFRNYFGPLILWKQIPLWIALVVALLPLLLRNKLAYFAVALFPICILPLAFVPDRGLEGVYIACAALPLALSAVLLKIPREDLRLPAAAALFLLAAVVMPGLRSMDGWDKENREIRAFRENLIRHLPQVPPKAQLRFVSEPFTDEYPWASTFITRLLYRDPNVLIVSPLNPHTRSAPESADYASFGWRDGALYRIK
jgi:hypothetical protein